MRKLKTRINFIPAEMRKSALRPSSLVLGALAAVAALPLLGLILSQLHSGAVATHQEQVQRLAALETQIQAKIAARDGGNAAVMKSVQAALAERLYWAEVFKELGNLGPEKIWLTSFTAKLEDKSKRVVISGNSTSQAEIAEFYARLEKSFYFRDLHIRFTESLKEIEPEMYRFEFEATLFEPKREVASGQI